MLLLLVISAMEINISYYSKQMILEYLSSYRREGAPGGRPFLSSDEERDLWETLSWTHGFIFLRPGSSWR